MFVKNHIYDPKEKFKTNQFRANTSGRYNGVNLSAEQLFPNKPSRNVRSALFTHVIISDNKMIYSNEAGILCINKNKSRKG